VSKLSAKVFFFKVNYSFNLFTAVLRFEHTEINIIAYNYTK